jgi:5'-nucleotidase
MVTALIDMDGVLTDLDRLLFNKCIEEGLTFEIDGVHQQTKRYLVDHLSPRRAQRGRARWFLEQEGWFRNLPVMPGAVDGIAEMEDAGWDVWVCTKPLEDNPWCASEKFQWLCEYFPSLKKKLIIAPDKSLIKGDFLLDDAHKVRWLESGRAEWEPVMFRSPYNGDGSKWGHIRSWTWGEPLTTLWNNNDEGDSNV